MLLSDGLSLHIVFASNEGNRKHSIQPNILYEQNNSC